MGARGSVAHPHRPPSLSSVLSLNPMASLSAEQTLVNLALKLSFKEEFFQVLELLEDSEVKLDFSAPVLLSGQGRESKKGEQWPLRKALVEESLSGSVYPSDYFRPENAERLIRFDPLFFSPEEGTDLLAFFARVKASENGLGFTETYRHSDRSDRWVQYILENTDQGLGDPARLLELGKHLVNLNCPQSLKWLMEHRPALQTMPDESGKFWMTAEASKGSAGIWWALLEAGMSPFATPDDTGAPLWRALVPKKTKITFPYENSLRFGVEEWLRQNRKTMPAEHRAMAERYLNEVGLSFLSSTPAKEEQYLKMDKLLKHLDTLPSHWVNHVPSGNNMAASLLFLFRMKEVARDKVEYEGMQWGLALDQNEAWKSAMTPMSRLCLTVFLIMRKKKSFEDSSLSADVIPCLQAPEVQAFFKYVEKKGRGTLADAQAVLARLKSRALDHTLPAPSEKQSKPRF